MSQAHNPVKIKMHGIPRNNGKIADDKRSVITTALFNSLAITWRDYVQPAKDPVVVLRCDPSYVYADLQYDKCDIGASLAFRSNAAMGKWLMLVQKAVNSIFVEWEAGRYTTVISVSKSGVV